MDKLKVIYEDNHIIVVEKPVSYTHLDVYKRQVYNNVTKNLGKDYPNMVLMHDFSGNKKTVNALRDIIRYCKSNGYILDKIRDDTPMITHKVAN